MVQVNVCVVWGGGCWLSNALLVSLLFLQWIPELKHYAPQVPIVLVGTKLGVCPNCESDWYGSVLLKLQTSVKEQRQLFCKEEVCNLWSGKNASPTSC